jgi:hypothetical protein
LTRLIHEYTPPRDAGHRAFRLSQIERKTGGSWIYVGTFPGDANTTILSPPFQNSWGNMGGGWQVLRFRWLSDGTIEIEGVVTGGVVGTVIFTLPTPLYTRYGPNDGDLPVPGVNIADFSHAAFKIAVNGDVSLEA